MSEYTKLFEIDENIQELIEKNYHNLIKNYNDIETVASAILDNMDIASYFDLTIYDGYLYLVSKVLTADYIFINKMVQINTALSKYDLSIVLEEIHFTKGIKILQRSKDTN